MTPVLSFIHHVVRGDEILAYYCTTSVIYTSSEPPEIRLISPLNLGRAGSSRPLHPGSGLAASGSFEVLHRGAARQEARAAASRRHDAGHRAGGPLACRRQSSVAAISAAASDCSLARCSCHADCEVARLGSRRGEGPSEKCRCWLRVTMELKENAYDFERLDSSGLGQSAVQRGFLLKRSVSGRLIFHQI